MRWLWGSRYILVAISFIVYYLLAFLNLEISIQPGFSLSRLFNIILRSPVLIFESSFVSFGRSSYEILSEAIYSTVFSSALILCLGIIILLLINKYKTTLSKPVGKVIFYTLAIISSYLLIISCKWGLLLSITTCLYLVLASVFMSGPSVFSIVITYVPISFLYMAYFQAGSILKYFDNDQFVLFDNLSISLGRRDIPVLGAIYFVYLLVFFLTTSSYFSFAFIRGYNNK